MEATEREGRGEIALLLRIPSLSVAGPGVPPGYAPVVANRSWFFDASGESLRNRARCTGVGPASRSDPAPVIPLWRAQLLNRDRPSLRRVRPSSVWYLLYSPAAGLRSENLTDQRDSGDRGHI